MIAADSDRARLFELRIEAALGASARYAGKSAIRQLN